MMKEGQGMKRKGNLWQEICSIENVTKSVYTTLKAQRNNAQKRAFISDLQGNINRIQQQLADKTFEFSTLYEFRVYEPKERIIHCPILTDKCVHHAIMDVCKPYIIDKLIYDTYGSIKGRGLQMCADKMIRNRRKYEDWYYVQIDCKKFYPSIPHDEVKRCIREVFKDKDLLFYLDKIIDRHQDFENRGLAIGVFPSQYLSNLVMNDVDRYAKEIMRIKWYFRYMDDIICFVPTKEDAHKVLDGLTEKIECIGMNVKNNARIAPFRCGIDIIGYKFYPTHTLIRKRTKLNMIRKARKLDEMGVDDEEWKQQMASYYGWIKHSNSRNLWKKLKGNRMIEFKKLSDMKPKETWFDVPKENRISVVDLEKEGRNIIFIDYMLVTIKNEEKAVVKFIYEDENCDNPTYHLFITRSGVIMDRLANDKELMPFSARIIKKKKYLAYE